MWTLSASADIRVAYTVDDKALKTAAISGTNLTFTVFSDAGCTTPIASPVVMPIDNILLIERMKRFTPKGGTKAPATDRLVQVLSGIVPNGPVFLTVTGTGVTPIGGACQFQFEFTAGTSLPCASQVGTDVYFTGCNVRVQSGSGSTNGATNGLGNLIVGYDANTGSHDQSGSHNLVVGDEHTYSSYGGLLAGLQNSVTKPSGSVTGGQCNVVGAGPAPSCVPIAGADAVSGGFMNVASGNVSSVTGGSGNTATNGFAAVSGGGNNHATGVGAWVSGGQGNIASGLNDAVSGGYLNVASGGLSSVSGGATNSATSNYASVSGGENNVASGSGAAVSGGNGISASGLVEWHAGQTSGFPTGTQY
jgi:hypothetical protein